MVNVEKYLGFAFDADAHTAVVGDDGVTRVNCWGLVRAVLKDLGVGIPDGPGGGWSAMLKDRVGHAVLVPRSEAAMAGDVVELMVLGERDGSPTRHVGVCVDAFKVLHASEYGVALVRLDTLRRTRRVVAIMRPRDLLTHTVRADGRRRVDGAGVAVGGAR